MKIIDKVFGTHSEREIKRIMPLVEKIEGLRPQMQALSDEELRNKTAEFKKRLAEGATLDDLLPEAYAAVREATARVLKTEHYRVQLIGGIIMTHGDDNGLVLPPRAAPIQAVVIPVAAHKPGVLDAAAALRDRLKTAGVRSKMDDSDNSPGWKFAEYEMKGVPLRVEIGPKDMEKGQCVVARRDTGEKVTVPLAELEETVKKLLDEVHDNMYAQALQNREDNTFDIASPEEAKAIAEGKGGFLRSKWCGSLECELAMKERAGVSSRCMPLKQSGTEGVCPVCGKPCKTDIYWGVAY